MVSLEWTVWEIHKKMSCLIKALNLNISHSFFPFLSVILVSLDTAIVCPWEAFGDMELSDLAQFGIV